jgi:hypothetical protein
MSADPGPLGVPLDPRWIAWSTPCLRATGFPLQLLDDLAAAQSVPLLDAWILCSEELRAARGQAIRYLGENVPTGEGAPKALWRKARRLLAKQRMPERLPPDARVGELMAVLKPLVEKERAARERWEAAFAVEIEALRGRLDAKLGDARLIEAILWQAPHLHETLIERNPAGSSAIERRRTMLLRYLQRYAAKNETIGFFGPVAWGWLDPGMTGITQAPGAALLADRHLEFEYWAVEALARHLSADPAILEQMRPRLHPWLRIEGDVLHIPARPTRRLPPRALVVLESCDGRTSAGEIAERLVRERRDLFAQTAQVMRILDRWHRRGGLVWQVEVPNGPAPERRLRPLLEAIADPQARQRALEPLDELERLRDRVAASRGDPPRLSRALRDVAAAFTRRTSLAAQRFPGESYAGRTLLFEDTRRDLTLRMGVDVLRQIQPALGQVLRSARWYANEVGARLHAALLDFHRSRDAAGGGAPASLGAYLAQFRELGARVPEEAGKELRARWARILCLAAGAREVRLSSAALEQSIAREFPELPLSWPHAGFHSPDLLVAARGTDEIERGEATWVLGELHVAHNTLMSQLFRATHPRPADMDRQYRRDVGAAPILRVIEQARKAHRPALYTEGEDRFEVDWRDLVPGAPVERRLAIVDLLVREGEGGLEVFERDGKRAFSIVEFFRAYLGDAVMENFALVPEGEHVPRVALDRLVLCRETWRVSIAGPSAAPLELRDSFAWTRRWAREQGFPRWIFAKLPGERKPFFVDLDAPYSVRNFLRMCRAAAEQPGLAVISEMLPDPQHCWLQDAEGGRYTSEIRLVVAAAEPWQRSGTG